MHDPPLSLAATQSMDWTDCRIRHLLLHLTLELGPNRRLNFRCIDLTTVYDVGPFLAIAHSTHD